MSMLTTSDLSLSAPAQGKMAELIGQVEEEIKGIRVYATAGGCSGISFGMTFTDQVNSNDCILACDGFDIIVDEITLEHLRGVEIDFIDREDGGASFVFNNLPQMSGGGGCGSCGSSRSQGGGCS